jgi:hypothetical protein
VTAVADASAADEQAAWQADVREAPEVPRWVRDRENFQRFLPPELWHLAAPIESVIWHPENPNEGDVDSIAESITTFTQYAPVVVQASTRYLAKGNHTFLALRQCGSKYIAVVPMPWDDTTTTAVLVGDNRHAEKSARNPEQLLDLLQRLERQDALVGTGYVEDDIQDLLATLDRDDDAPVDDGSEQLSAGAIIYDRATIERACFDYFRTTGWPERVMPVHVCLQELNALAIADSATLLNTRVGYHIADTYHPHRFRASAEGMKAPYDAFHDDKLLMRAIRLCLDGGDRVGTRLFSELLVVSGTQAAANFRPGFALMLYRKYCQRGAVVLDTSTGYGGRLVGFLASGLAGTYIGIDPNVPTHNGNARLAHDLGVAECVELINLPAEDVDHARVRERCDFAFTSPPYFAKEHYSDDATQSWVRYKSGDDWRDGFLLPMLALQHAALKVGSYALVNIADVSLRGKTYPLTQWCRELAQRVGFSYVRTDHFPLNHRFGNGKDEPVPDEDVIVLHKSE